MKPLASYGRAARPFLLGAASYQLASGLGLLCIPAVGPAPQAVLLVHIGLGLALTPLLACWLAYHVPRVRRSPRAFQRRLGTAVVVLATAAIATGLGIVAYALGGRWPGNTLADCHRVIGVAGGTLLWLHLGLAARKPEGRQAVRGGVASLAIAALAATTAVALVGRLGEAALGADDPSGAALSTSRAVWERRPPRSESCSTTGCHREIHDEWHGSPHGRADRDPYYLALEAKVPEGRARYCSECHDPVLLATGRFARSASGAVAHTGEGVSCFTCHSMREENGKATGGPFQMEPPLPGLTADTPLGRFVILASLELHRVEFTSPLYERSRLCAGCHRATVSEEIPGFGLLRIENPYGRWELDRVKPKCQGCHMQKTAGGLYGRYPSHRFAGATTGGAGDEQRAAVERMLHGGAVIPDVQGKNALGPLFVLAAKKISETEIALTIADQNRIGHQFPAGAQDLLEIWIEGTLRRADGTELGHWGESAEGGPLLPGTPAFARGGFTKSAGKTVPVSHPWDLAPSQGFMQLRPGESRTVILMSPSLKSAELEASLWYRKIHRKALQALGSANPKLPPKERLATVRTKF